MSLRNKSTIEEGIFWETMATYHVPEEWARELHNYFVKGFEPGSFHTALLANDLFGSVSHSHYLNEWASIMYFMKWVAYNAPLGSWGNYQNVQNWLALTEEERKAILIRRGLILTDEEVMWKVLNAHG